MQDRPGSIRPGRWLQRMNNAGPGFLLSFTKKIVDRCCRLRCLPCRDADLVQTFNDIADRKQAWYGSLLVRVGQNATLIADFRAEFGCKLGVR